MIFGQIWMHFVDRTKPELLQESVECAKISLKLKEFHILISLNGIPMFEVSKLRL